ncbi:tyrosine-type recombinase/integrase [Shewanella donghaensis]|uniref:tyrosine-type recombinase/integrase n=1 Tax=Shewanella donghaensis TaxID=238836 RepID=UPI001315A708|nr:site-specific integrase [Shewanella donghaensis]
MEELTDGKGLGVRISKTGHIKFQFRYKIKGKSKRIDLGSYPDLSLKQARDHTQECRAWLANGSDPKIARAMAFDKSFTPITIEEALEYWIENYARQKRKAKGFKSVRAQFNKHIYPYIGHFDLEKTDMSHWLVCFDRICNGIEERQKPGAVAAGQVLQNCKQALKFCRVRRYAISHELDDLEIGFVGKKANKKDRILSTSELRDLLLSINQRKGSWYMRHICLLLIIFGARTQEIRRSTVEEWDLVNQLWTVPKEHSKNGAKIIRPIPPQVMPLIKALLKRNAKTGYLLGELRSDCSVSGSGGRIYQQLNHNDKWTLHDLRRTFSTKLNDLDVEDRVVEVLVGHAITGSEGHYNYSRYLNKSAKALDMWCDWLEHLVSPIDNVVEIEMAKAS